MQETEFQETLFRDGHIDGATLQRINEAARSKPFSLNFEVQSLLFAGISMLFSGLGILVYDNLNTIGHSILIVLIGISSALSFRYCFRKRSPYSGQRVTHAPQFFDHILLLACLSFVVFEGYAEYQYGFAGEHYSLLLLVPTIALFCAAYLFDNLGVLSMAITGLASFFGICTKPAEMIRNADLYDRNLLLTTITVGMMLALSALYLKKRDIKSHFTNTYLYFSSIFILISSLLGLFMYSYKLIWFIAVAGFALAFIQYARKTKTFFFVALAVIILYIAFFYFLAFLTYKAGGEEGGFIIVFMLLIASGLYTISFLRNFKKNFYL